MSNVEKFWSAIIKSWPNQPQPQWNDMHPQNQMAVVQAINIILQVLNANTHAS